MQTLVTILNRAELILLADLRVTHPEIDAHLSDNSSVSTNIYLNPHKTTDTNRNSVLDFLLYHTGVYTANGANDLMIGMDQEDYMYGNEGNDVLIGEGGDDDLVGGEGNDVLYGGAGNDVFIGGQGDDMMYGGTDDNTYIINAGDRNDTIEDKQGKNKIVFCGEEIKFFY